MVVIAVVVVAIDDDAAEGAGATTTTTAAAPGPTFSAVGAEYAYPTPHPGADAPLGTPAPLRRAGSFAFLRTQPGTETPVAWDPCRPITVVVADADAPAGSDDILGEALAQVQQATGLRIEVEGTTDEPAAEVRAPVQPERYGDRWAPLLVAWTDPARAPALDGDTGGLGGAMAVAPPGGGPEVYVTGQLLLDAPQLDESLRLGGDQGRAQVLSVILHEMGHVLGLAHVDDAGQLMYPEGRSSVTAYGFGDRAGLIELGTGPCVDGL